MTDIIENLPTKNFVMRTVEDEDFKLPHVANPKMAEHLLRKEFLHGVDGIVDYWGRLPNKTTKEKMTGALFSVFAMLDGDGDFPPCDIISRQHDFSKVDGQTVIVPAGTNICDGELHSQFVNRTRLLEEVASYQVDCEDD